MTTLVQFEENELKEIIRTCVRDAVSELIQIKPEPLQDKINKDEVKRMTGRDDSWIYKKTMKTCSDPLPFQKFGKELIFSRKAIQHYIDSHTKSVASASDVMTERLARSAKKHIK